jgi:tetratricopeptide (TPR) repeat protein
MPGKKKTWAVALGILALVVATSMAQNALRPKRESIIIFDDIPVYGQATPTASVMAILQKGHEVSVTKRSLVNQALPKAECWNEIEFDLAGVQKGFVRCEELQQPLGAPRANDTATGQTDDPADQVLALVNVDLIPRELDDSITVLLSNKQRADENDEQVRSIFEDARNRVPVLEAVRTELAPYSNTERMHGLIQQLRQPLMEKVRVLSARTKSAGAGRDLVPFFTNMVSIPTSDRRTHLLERIEKANGEPENSVEYTMLFARAFVHSGLQSSQKADKPSPKQLEQYFDDLRTRLLASTARRVRIASLYSFAPLTDDELEMDAKFEESPDALWLRSLIKTGLLKAVSDYAAEISTGLAKLRHPPYRMLENPSGSHDAQELYQQAVQLIDHDQPTQAVPFLDAVIQLEPRNALAYYKRGNAHRDAEQAALARLDYAAAISLAPSMALAYLNLGNTLRFLKQKEEAMDVYNRGLAVDPNMAALWFQRGINDEDFDRFKEAIADYTQAVRLTPWDGEALAWRGMAHGELGQSMRSKGIESYPEWKRSWQDCEAGIRLGIRPSEQSPVYTCVGRALELMSDYAGALKALNRAIELDPSHAVDYQHRGYSLEQMNNLVAL